MSEIMLVIFTYQTFNKNYIAENFFDTLSESGTIISKIGLTEPLKIKYSREKAIELWCSETEGCYDLELEKMVGKTGCFMGKAEKQALFIHSHWWECPNKKALNFIILSFSVKVFLQKKWELTSIFKHYIKLFNGEFGYITHRFSKDRQHITGTPDLRLPGVFWSNYYSNEYLALMNCREQMESFDWWKKEDMEEGTMAFLSEDPKELVEPNYLEENARQHFGEEVFLAKERT
ncbi:hypothetical protein YDYSY3_02640 [Paenibacillus chitinolyticus]|uniref:hypothetical protein n=1 Tax=Paenibacillus chitinolyticus TaxID=79263 RepID=UPI0026E4CB79|nr:hypothetical protein [Paenibacillus chitinolyticus]GKS09264.1 hypothetical protein YDYSY3_02640 [Paenibacillus chitinolyticus]